MLELKILNILVPISPVYAENVTKDIKNFKEKAKKEIGKLTAMNVVELDVVVKYIYVPGKS